MTEKTCKRCREVKALTDFNRDRRNEVDGRQARCRQCEREVREETRDRRLRVKSLHYQSNREAIRASQRRYYTENAREVKEKSKDYYHSNISKGRESRRRYKRENLDSVREANRRYSKSVAVHRNRHRYSTDVEYRLGKILRASFRRVVIAAKSRKRGTTESSVGYGPASLRLRMEAQFKPGMSWGNYGEWQIDHKIPVAHFIAKGETRPRIINALCNLQPLWAEDNLKKRDSHPLEEPNHDLHTVI